MEGLSGSNASVGVVQTFQDTFFLLMQALHSPCTRDDS